MAEQRQSFHFRLPWSAAPSAPRISEKPQIPSETPTQADKRPFRPAGVAPTQSSPTAQNLARIGIVTKSSPGPSTTSQSSSRPGVKRQVVPPPRAPPASPSRTVPKPQVATKPDLSERVGPQIQQVRKSLAKSPSPPPKAAKPVTSDDPTMKPSTSKAPPQLVQETKPISSPKKNPDTSEISGPQEVQERNETPQPSSQKPQVMENITPQPEKVVEALEEQNEQPTPKERNLTVPNLYGAEPKSKQQSTDETSGAASKEPADILDGAASKEQAEILFSHKYPMTRENVPSSKDIKEDLPKASHKLGGLRDKHEEIEKPFSIITLSGENTGASMHLSSEPWSIEKAIHIHRGYKLNPEDKVDTDAEGSSRDRKSRETKSREETGTTVYLNNNTQGINNSLVFSSSVTQRNPGAHVVYSRKEAEPVKAREDTESLQTRRAEVSSIPAESLTYIPNIRRRCLRGLMMESRDSDPEKPHRHGCQAGCNQQSKEDHLNVL